MKLTKSQLKQIIKEEVEKVLQEGGSYVEVGGVRTAELYDLTNLAMAAQDAGKTRMEKELDNGMTVTAIWKGDPNYVEGDLPHGGSTDVESGQPFIWAGVPNVQWIIDQAGGQMELPLEEPHKEREMSPSLFSRIRGALGRGDKERVAELLKKVVIQELREIINKKK